MKNPKGISFQIGFLNSFKPRFTITSLCPGVTPHYKDAEGNWKVYPKGGLRFDLLVGRCRRPMPKFWKREFWLTQPKDYVRKNQATNPWNSGNYWFILDIPWMPAFFLSCCFGLGKKQPGFYIGFKTYRVDWISCQLKKYKDDRNDEFIFDDNGNKIWTWCNENELENNYLCVSACIRADVIDQD